MDEENKEILKADFGFTQVRGMRHDESAISMMIIIIIIIIMIVMIVIYYDNYNNVNHDNRFRSV